MTPRRVVVTGRGVVTPLGVGTEAYWQAVLAGRTAVGPVEALRPLGLDIQGAVIADALIQPYVSRLPRKQQKLYNRATLLAMLASTLAMEESGLGAGAGDAGRFGVVLGVSALAWEHAAMLAYVLAAESPETPGTLDMALANAYCMRHINPLEYSLKTLPNLAAGHVAIAHDAQGLCRALAEGSVAGAHALGQACRAVAEGDLDVALAGGTDCELEPMLATQYAGIGLLAGAGGGPGLASGEGAGIAVLEDAERARARGAPVLAEVLGVASAAGDGHAAPEGDAGALGRRLGRVLDAALAEAGERPDLVSLHGDGVPVHDAAETLALRAALGPAADAVPVLRLKRAHGHLGAASGPVEFLACSSVPAHAIIPAIASDSSPVSLGPCRRVLVVSVGLFGECAALVLGRPDSTGAW